jgi:hypothetical protein
LGIVGSGHVRHLSVDVWKIVKSGRLLKQYEHLRVPFDPVKSGLKDFLINRYCEQILLGFWPLA